MIISKDIRTGFIRQKICRLRPTSSMSIYTALFIKFLQSPSIVGVAAVRTRLVRGRMTMSGREKLYHAQPQNRVSHDAFVPMLEEGEFQLARRVVDGFGSYCDYEDWLDAREGRDFGLEMAGLSVKQIKVNVVEFLQWCLMTSTFPSETALGLYVDNISTI